MGSLIRILKFRILATGIARIHMKIIFSVSVMLFLFFIPTTSEGAQRLTKDQVHYLCTEYYSTLISNIIGALNMGMSIEEVKNKVRNDAVLSSLIDILATDKEQEKLIIFNKLVNACIAANYNAPKKI